jgi:hypothetical protein
MDKESLPEEKKDLTTKQLENELQRYQNMLDHKNYDRDGTIALNRSQIISYSQKLYSQINSSSSSLSIDEKTELTLIYTTVEKRIQDGDYDDEINAQGNIIIREFREGRQRYHYDFNLLEKGWKQFDTDQDASYFGIWHSEDEMRFLTFAEGDETLVICKDAVGYNKELDSMLEFYKPTPFAVSIDLDGGSKTQYYDERPNFIHVQGGWK